MTTITTPTSHAEFEETGRLPAPVVALIREEAAGGYVGDVTYDRADHTNTQVIYFAAAGRAACNAIQGAGDWQWTDAESIEDAHRRYLNDDMAA